jgi:hypothetical protein
MTRIFLVTMAVLAVALTAVRADDSGFSGSLSAEDLKAAGLDHLSPAQIQRLNELVRAYQGDEVAAARKSADAAKAAQKAAETEAGRAQAAQHAAEAETKKARTENAEAKKTSQSFLSKAKVLLVPGTSIEYAVVQSTIVGKFSGWQGKTVFQLANGQYWQVTNNGESYFTPPKENVEVTISPAALGGFWMDFPKLKARVRVRLMEGR